MLGLLIVFVAAFVLGCGALRFSRVEEPPRLEPPPGVDSDARCDTCGYYQWPAACLCVVAQRHAADLQ